MIPRQLGRYIRYWYTYRTAVAVLIALILTGAMFWLYTQQLTCDAHQDGCVANVSVHPEDRFAVVTSTDEVTAPVDRDRSRLGSDIGAEEEWGSCHGSCRVERAGKGEEMVVDAPGSQFRAAEQSEQVLIQAGVCVRDDLAAIQ